MRRLPSIALLLLCTLAAGGIAQSDNPDSFDDLLLAARQAQSSNDYAAAVGYYRRAVQLRTDIPELWANLGLMQDATASYPDAIISFHKALQLKPSLYVPNLFLGIDYLHLNRAHDAVPFLLKAEAINPNDAQAPVSLGRAYLSLGNFAAARGAYQRALALDPKNSSAWFAFGVAALDEVEADGRKLSGENANSAYARALFAESLREQARFKEAVTEEQAVLAADPHFPCARARLGFLYLAQRLNDDAAREFAAESSGCALAGLGHARLRIEADDDAAALALLSDLWKSDSGFVMANFGLLLDGLAADRLEAFSALVDRQNAAGAVPADLSASLLAAVRGAPQPVDELLTQAGLAQPRNARESEPPPNLSTAEADARAGRYARCTADLSHGAHDLSHNTLRGNADALLLLAGCAWMTGDYALSASASDLVAAQSSHGTAALYWSIQSNEKLAFVAFSRFEQLEPDSKRTHLLLGDMYRQRQHLQQAENEYKAAAALAPQDPAPLFGLASAYSQDSKLDQALATAKTALSMSPDDPDLNVLVGQILVGQHEWAQAESYLKHSLNTTPPIKPQMLPHVHVLLGEVYEQTDRPQEAINQFQMGLSSDEDGSVYYQLSRIYIRMGNKAAAQDAIAHVKALEQKRRERAVIAVQETSAPSSDVP
jgi:tetratricopeptide (TPR) repeat protein